MATAKKSKTVVKITEMADAGLVCSHALNFKHGTPASVIVAALKTQWVKVRGRVEQSDNPLAQAFAEVYDPFYCDDKSGDLTDALNKATNKPVLKPKQKVPDIKLNKPVSRIPVKRVTASKVPKSQLVRELIAANPTLDLEGLVAAVNKSDIGLKKNLVKSYVSNNMKKVRN